MGNKTDLGVEHKPKKRVCTHSYFLDSSNICQPELLTPHTFFGSGRHVSRFVPLCSFLEFPSKLQQCGNKVVLVIHAFQASKPRRAFYPA